MSPAYTTTSAHPNIIPNVVFDFGTQIISVPSSVGSINGQWLIDHARQAEESSVGQAYPAIAVGSGKVEIDTDIVTGLPVVTGVLAILRTGWLIQTLKTSGRFVITDIFKSAGALPYVDTGGVDIRYRQTLNSTVVSTSTGGGGFTSDDRAALLAIPNTPLLAGGYTAPNNSGINDIVAKLTELYKRQGLANGVTATVRNAETGTPGSLVTSDTLISQVLTKNSDGSITIARL